MKETNFKHTDIGLIPNDWEVKTIGEVAKIVGGGTPSTSVDKFWNGNIQWFTPAEITNAPKFVSNSQRTITEAGLKKSSARLLPKGTILLTTRATIGAAAVLLNEACTNQGFQSLIVNEDNDNNYLYYLIPFIKGEMLSRASGSTFAEISAKKLSTIEIPLPPTIDEQKRIAEALQNIDSLIEALDEQIAKKQAIKTGAMQQLLKGEEIEPVLMDDLVKSGDITLYRGKVISKKDIEACPGDYPIYSSSVQNEGLMGRYGKYMFDEEMISWSVDGGGNFFYRPKHKFSITNVSGYMRVNKEKLDYRFLAYLLQSEHAKKVFDYQTKAHPSVIRKEYFLRIPDIQRQRSIAEVLSNMDAEIQTLQDERNKYALIKQGMMQELLTGKIRI